MITIDLTGEGGLRTRSYIQVVRSKPGRLCPPTINPRGLSRPMTLHTSRHPSALIPVPSISVDVAPVADAPDHWAIQ